MLPGWCRGTAQAQMWAASCCSHSSCWGFGCPSCRAVCAFHALLVGVQQNRCKVVAEYYRNYRVQKDKMKKIKSRIKKKSWVVVLTFSEARNGSVCIHPAVGSFAPEWRREAKGPASSALCVVHSSTAAVLRHLSRAQLSPQAKRGDSEICSWNYQHSGRAVNCAKLPSLIALS